MQANRTWPLLLALGLTGACAVPLGELGDVQERVERREIKRQLRLLSSSDEATWQEAYGRLVERSDQAVPHLVRAFDAREPLASRAVLVLGEIANGSTIAQLRTLQDDARLGPAAIQALKLSEESLWRAVKETGLRTDCEAYLTWFPGGQYRWEVQQRLSEVDALAAYETLGNKATDEALALFLQEFGSTEIGATVRIEQAQKSKTQAATLLETGDLPGAHLALQQAQSFDPELDLRELESKIRARIGRLFASEGRVDEAIAEFSRALELGDSVEMELGRLLVDRSRVRQEERDFLSALRDLLEAKRVYSSLEAVVKRRIRSIERQLLMELEAGQVDGEGVAESLLLAGEESRAVLREQLRGGVNTDLIESLAKQSKGEREAEAVLEFRLEAVGLYQGLAEERAAAFLSDTNRIERLMDGEKLWHPSQGPSRDEARRVVYDVERGQLWENQVREGEAGTGAEERFYGTLRAEAERSFLEDDHRPDRPSLDLNERVRSLGLMMALHSELQQMVEENPLAFSTGLVGRERLPKDLAEWVALVLEKRESAALNVRNGSAARLTLPPKADSTMTLRLDVEGNGVSSEEAVAEALTLLFGTSRSLVQHHPDINGVEVEVYDRGIRRVRVALTRDSIRRINWPLIQAETPFGMDHLVFVFDQEVD